MYTICYVLSDNKSMFVYSELLISVESLLVNGKHNRVVVLVDQVTIEEIGDILLKEMQKRNVQVITVQVPEAYSQKEKSRYLKTSIRKYISGDILYIDTDTVIVRRLPEIISNNDLAMVPEFHLQRKDVTPQRFLQWDVEQYKKCDLQVDMEGFYFNSGVMWVRDSPKSADFFSKWHEWWLFTRGHEVTNDQISLNYVNTYIYPLISPLSDFFNVQLVQTSGQSLPIHLLGEAIIFHYFHLSDSPYALSSREVRGKGIDDQEIQHMIQNPYEAFIPGKIVKYDEKFEEMQKTPLFCWIKNLYHNHTRIYFFLDNVIQRLSRMKKGINDRFHH